MESRLCPSLEGEPADGPSIRVTDTLLQFDDATCNVREREPENSRTDVEAFCATPDGRETREITLHREAESELTVSYTTEGQEETQVRLVRCSELR